MVRDTFHVFAASCRLLAVSALITLVFTSTASAAAPPSVTAKDAVVVDADTGAVLFDKSMNTEAPEASLTKIFTAIYALESAPLTRTVTASQYDLVGESSMGLSAGEKVSLKTALYGMLLPSGNDAAMTVAQNLGAEPGDTPQQSVQRYVGWVNNMAARLGLSHTHLMNPHGLDQPGHYTSARDLAAVTMYALKNAEFRKIIGTPYYNGDGHQLYQANRLLGSYPGLIGGKTGITDNAGYCLVEAAERNGHTIIAVLMHSTDAAWYQDANTLLDYGFSAVGSGESVQGVSPITLSPVVIQPGTNGVAATPQAAKMSLTSAAPSQLSVHQVNDNVAVVSHNLLAASSSGFSWKWPLTSLVTMIAMLAIVLNYQVVIGAGSLLLRHSRPAGRMFTNRFIPLAGSSLSLPHAKRSLRTRRSSRRRRTSTTTSPENANAEPAYVPESSMGDLTAPTFDNVVSLNAAETIATRGVRLALRGDYHAASSEFMRALRADASFDLTRCAGFWSMQPAGYVAAARAYAIHDRNTDAKSLLTVIKLSCGTHKELETLLHKVVTPAVH